MPQVMLPILAGVCAGGNDASSALAGTPSTTASQKKKKIQGGGSRGGGGHPLRSCARPAALPFPLSFAPCLLRSFAC